MRLRKILVPVAMGAIGIATLTGPASAKPANAGTENFSFTADINNEGGGPVTAGGVISDQGTDVVVSDSEDTFVFPDVQITVFHSPRHIHEKISQKKCTFSITERGTYVLGN